MTPAAFRALEPKLDPAWLVLVAEPAIVEGVTGFKFHRGCLALVRRPDQRLPLSAFAQARRLILLEAVGNPDNIGGIFRSATALGADAVLLDPACGDPFYRKAVRTSMGAVLRLPSTRVDPWLPGLATLRDMGFAIVALSPTGELTLEEFLATLSADARLALVAGAEGLRPEHRHDRRRGRDRPDSRRPAQRFAQHRRGRVDRFAAVPTPSS